MISRRLVYPVLLPFPIWRYGELYGRLDGEYIGMGWWPDKYGVREVAAAERVTDDSVADS